MPDPANATQQPIPLHSTTMALSVIRSLITEDQERLNASALRFADRHGIKLDLEDLGAAEELYQHLSWDQGGPSCNRRELKRLWQACRCRALKVKVDASITTEHGYVGYSVA